MALGRRQTEQQELWEATLDLARSPGHPFFQKLKQLLVQALRVLTELSGAPLPRIC